MTPEDWERAKTLFHDALAQPEEARQQWLDRHCTDAPEIAAEVHALLAAHAEADTEADPGSERDEPRIARYRILGRLGVGGFGTVYRARQLEPVQREVALKVLRTGVDSAPVVRRFELEREALARMQHPAIAQIWDAGTTDAGQPFFAMECVDGPPITRWCDQHELPLAARLELFVQVCHGVAHAHLKGVIHRDLKPGNVLVATVDGEPAAKIIDFGIAKATLGGDPADASDLRTIEGRCLGTPGYMSPEQASLEGGKVDVRTDVYALGVVLYELLTGRLPHDPGRDRPGGLLDYLRAVRDQEAPRPSTVVTSRDTTAAALRSATPAILRRGLRGDLDWITWKALARDPDRRYQSVADLAHDLERHLRHEPVSVGPPGAGYRIRKFVRRHLLAVGSATGILLALVGGLIAALWQTAAARAALAEAVGHRLAAQAVNLSSDQPTLALLLAIEGARRAPGENADTALFTALAENREAAVADVHDGIPQWLGCSRDERRMLTGDSSGLVLSWDLPALVLRHRFDVHDAALTSLTIRDDGRLGCSTDEGGRVLVLDLDAGVVLRTLPHPAAVRQAAWLPGGGLLTVCDDGLLRRFDDGGTEHLLGERGAALLRLAVDRRGERVAVLDHTGWIAVLAIADGAVQFEHHRPARRPDGPPTTSPELAITDDGRWLVALSPHGQVTVLDLQQVDAPWQPTTAACRTIALAAQAGVLFVAPMQEGVPASTFDLASHTPRATFADPTGQPFRRAAIDPLGRVAVTGQDGRPTLDLWDGRTGRKLARLGGDPHAIYAPHVSSDSEWIVGVGHVGTVRCWRTGVFDERRAIGAWWQDGWSHCQMLPPGNLALLARPAGDQGSELVWRRPQDGTVERVGAVRPAVLELALTPRADTAMVGDASGTELIRVADGTPLARLPHAFQRMRANVAATHLCGLVGTRVQAVEIATGRLRFDQDLPGTQYVDVNPDGSLLVTADGSKGTATVWSTASGKPVTAIAHRGFVFDAMFTRDGAQVLSFGNDTSLRITAIDGHAQVARLRAPTSSFGWVHVDPTGRHFAVQTREELSVWELSTRRRIGRWRPEDPQVAVARAVFAADGESVFVQLADGRQRRLPLDPLAAAIRAAPRKLTSAERSSYGLEDGAPEPTADQPLCARVLLEHVLAACRARDLPGAEALLQRAQATRARMPPRCLFAIGAVLALRAELEGPLADLDRNRAAAAITGWIRSGDGSVRLAQTMPELAALQREAWFQDAVAAAGR